MPDTEHTADTDEAEPTASRTVSEAELGRIFVEAQRFTDDALAKLESQVERVLAEASDKAAHIVLEAREEADQILRHARESLALPSADAKELQRAVGNLTQLVGDLGALLRGGSAKPPAGSPLNDAEPE